MSLHRAFLFLVLFAVECTGRAAETPPLILISLDAFRWDYTTLHPAETPNLRRLAREGVTTRGLIPVFPSNTFPNHYSIVTGLYPSHHGVINNLMFDTGLGAFFRYNQASFNRDDRWWGGEPIWTTAVKQGRTSACAFWPGSEAAIGGVRPTWYKPYAYDTTPFETRLDELVGWLRLPPDKRPAVVTFYLEETNAAGHNHGPDSPQVVAAIQLLDTRVGAMAARLAAEGLTPNLVIVSDHGMAGCSMDRVTILDDYLDLATIQIDFEESCAGLRPKDGTDVDTMMRALAKIPPEQGRAYRTADLPPRFHLDAAHPRVPPVWIVPTEGWNVMRRSLHEKAVAKNNKGQHGYDPAFSSMHGIFIAHGPSFKSGVTVDAVENIHVYNLLCAAAALTPARNDGDTRLVKAALK